MPAHRLYSCGLLCRCLSRSLLKVKEPHALHASGSSADATGTTLLVFCAPCDRTQTGSCPSPVPPGSRDRSVQGALLLGLFNISHVVETSLSRRAQGDLTSLYDQIPSTAVIVALLASGAPDMSTASTRPASDVPVGAHMLVRPGQQVCSRRVSTLPNIRAVGLAGLERAPGCACRTARSAGCAV